MDKQTIVECQKDIKQIKVVYRLHLMYVVIICFILMVCTLCIIPRCVSIAAFQNFSFASTIVSIVLAVVSIVYSLWSGQKSNNQYVGMAHIESKIDDQLKGFERIEESISDRLNPINRQIEQIKDDQTKTRAAVDEMKDMLGKDTTSGDKDAKQQYNMEGNPLFADISLYIFAQAHANNKVIPVDIAEELIGRYWSGFMVAFSRSHPEKLNYETIGKDIKVTVYNSDYFENVATIKKRILEKSEALKGKLLAIDNALGISSEINEKSCS